ncbi:TPA: nucleotidyltransferase domain-containing protein [Candidatus Berkelbacteria bacterium]|uniref:Polymerase nucleotidyl transferase domain-containing protein n=1 Tax=Berkelbacteria bacterium GW2011_GWE1_39_12 TaxID=1618337 RepID=A0A0G4B567_9BACT|nr:MAG: hypothetical protein UT28_C0001G0338 [Berkelbacteria bacterium GW2011_GWE1_39_12]HBO60729.1 nucleotidyltransferase domain-containing protein [Candidatus Berkelbacteria bacterium]
MKVFEKEYLRRAKVVAYWLQLAPFVRMVGLNGSLSRGEAKVTSDIDFLIIAQKHRIWICRFFVTLITELSGYRRQGEKVAGMICLNRYQTTDYLDVKPHNEYHARVFSQLIPLTDIDNTYSKYLKKNDWMKKENFPVVENRSLVSESRIMPSIRALGEKILSGSFGDNLEKILGKIQKKRILTDKRTLESPKGRIRVSDKELCFHPIKE